VESGVAGISNECSNNGERSWSSIIGKEVDARH